MASLDGFTIGITADRRWQEQAELFTRRGAHVLHGPTLATRFLSEDPELRAATAALVARPPELLIATTGIGIRAWLEAASVWGIAEDLLAALAVARTVARGPKAAAALAQAGLPVHLRAESERMEEIAELLESEPAAGGRVALQRYGEDSREVLAALDRRGAEVVALSVYQWQLPADTTPARRLVSAACSGELDAVTFTSAPAVGNLFRIAEEIVGRDELLGAFGSRRVIAGCVGPVCAGAARDAGIADPLWPGVGRLGLLVRMLVDQLAARPRRTHGRDRTPGPRTRHDPE